LKSEQYFPTFSESRLDVLLEDAAHVLGYPFSPDVVHKVPGNYLREAVLKVRESVTVSRGISGAIKWAV